MTNDSVISSVLSPGYLAEIIKKNYDLGSAIKCGVIKTGVNHSYLVSSEEVKYVLRVYFIDWKTEIEIGEELKLLEYLKESGVSVSYPIKDRLGKYIQKVQAPEGERFAVLFSYAEGEAVRMFSEKLCYQLGKTMAQMHQLTVNRNLQRKNYDAETLVNWAFLKANEHFTEASAEMEYFARVNSKITDEFKNADTNDLRNGIVHLDLWHDNMRIRNESEFTFFDFDNCGNGWLFLDISYSLMLIFRNEPDKEKFRKKQQQLFKGYESVTVISDEEYRLMPLGGPAIWLHYTGIHVQRFNDFSNHFFNEEFLKYWIRIVKDWMEFNQVDV